LSLRIIAIEFKKIKRVGQIYFKRVINDLLPESIVWRKNKFGFESQIEFGYLITMIK
jgi:hypothetical protein